MKDFKFTPTEDCPHGFIGFIVYQGNYNCTISVFKKAFYVEGKDSHMIPITEELLKFIKKRQDKFAQ